MPACHPTRPSWLVELMNAKQLRALPSVDRLLAHPAVQAAADLPRSLLVELVRETITAARAAVVAGAPPPGLDALAASVLIRRDALLAPSLRPVINATGVIIHTNLGRAPLSKQARAAMDAVGQTYSNLEFDLEAGQRGSRYSHLESLLQRLTGAEAGIAVNNNAGALLLALSALTASRQVVISRSQAVEIGGGFRIPDVMRQSGAELVEVGTTNRTYLSDFDSATGERSAAYLRVHASNFRISGFTTFPKIAELADLAHRRGLLLIDDLGSGCLIPVERFGLAPEPLVQASVAAGADLSLFSGDKLLGGPQAGIIVGGRALIQRLRSHPLARALRMDKASIAALTATLSHYLLGEALTAIPVWQMIAADRDQLEERAVSWAAALDTPSQILPGRSMIGGGSLPEESLPTCLLALAAGHEAEVAARLRRGTPPVIARSEQGLVLLDPRTVLPEQDADLLVALRRAVASD